MGEEGNLLSRVQRCVWKKWRRQRSQRGHQLLGLRPAPPHCVRWSRQGGGQVHLWSLSAENPGEVHCWREAAGDASKAWHGQLDGGYPWDAHSCQPAVLKDSSNNFPTQGRDGGWLKSTSPTSSEVIKRQSSL